MISLILFTIWIFAFFLLGVAVGESKKAWLVYSFTALLWIVPIFTGVPIKNQDGQFHVYVTAQERSGAIFQVQKVYLKTELESSDQKVACVDEDNTALIEELRQAQKQEKKVTLQYEGYWQFPLNKCHGASWMITAIET